MNIRTLGLNRSFSLMFLLIAATTFILMGVPNGHAANMKFDNIAISVSNVDKSAEWYARLFGFKVGYRTYLNELQADFVVLERSDVRIELISQKNVQKHEDALVDPPNHLGKTRIIAVVFSTDDLEQATKLMEEQNVTFVWKLQTLSADGLRSTMLRDPDGNLVNVLSYPK